MTGISFTTEKQPDITVLSNDFIDHYMVKADGEYVKIYLLLLRLIHSNKFEGIDQLADLLELTQKDIWRAINYWKKQGLLQIEEPKADTVAPKTEPVSEQSGFPPDSGGSKGAPALAGTVIPLPPKDNLSPLAMQSVSQTAELKHSIYMAEAYLGRPLSTSELNSFCYMDTSLKISPDLMEYLIEYCVSRGKKSVRYMESVAINWYQKGIDSVEKAKEHSSAYHHNVFAIMRAFGLSGRSPGTSELEYITKWNQMGFDTEIIEEACGRSLMTTHQASFPYANRILEEWKKQNIRTMDDIRVLDEQFHTREKASPDGDKKNSGLKQQRSFSASNPFHNFEQRSYNYDDLESRLLDQ